MRIHQLWSQSFAKLGLLLMLGASMNADAGFLGFGGDSWKEEVLLHDGSKIVVERTVEHGGRHEIGQKPPYKEQTLTFTHPAIQAEIVWEDKFSEDVGSANFLPMLLDISNGTPYLVAHPMGCLSYNKWGRPNPPYVVFRHDGKEWQRIPLQELPAEIKTVNLIFSMPDFKVKQSGKRFMTAEMIGTIIAGYMQPEYRTILREPIRSAGQGCGELIRVNDGWEGTGFFSGQPSKEACFKYCGRKEVSAQNCPCNRFFK